jgi:hypothetical protein
MACAGRNIYNSYMFTDVPQGFFDADHAAVDGTIMLVLGLMFLVATFRGDTRPMPTVWIWISTAAGFAIAMFLILQGGILLLG